MGARDSFTEVFWRVGRGRGVAGPARGRTPPPRPVPCPLPFPLIPKWVERPRLSRTPRASTCGGWDYRTRAPGAGLCPPCVRRARDPACARATPPPFIFNPHLFLCSPSDGTTRACVRARALPPRLWERKRSGERKGGAGSGVERAGGRGVCSLLCVCVKERLASRPGGRFFSFLFRASPICRVSRAGEGRGPIEGGDVGCGGK
jgi:hypothetical protein